jgi:hypothetical protein
MTMDMYYLPIGSDSEVTTDPRGCAVHVLCLGDSRMAAVQTMRSRHISWVSTKRVRVLTSIPEEPGELPTLLPGEVWVKPVYQDGVWVRR